MKLFKKLHWIIKFWLNGFPISHIGLGGGFGGDEPEAPGFNLPPAFEGIDQEVLDLIRSRVGQQAGVPGEFGVASQTLQGLLGISPQQFQFPMEEIQKALQAQQSIGLQRFREQITPLAAQQGQLESTGFTNQIANFLQGQEAQGFGQTADLLTQQALRNFQLQQFLPQFQAGIAGQLGQLGGQLSDIERFNLQLPFQTTIPAFQQQQGLGLQQAQGNFQADSQRFQQQLAEQAQKAELFKGLGGLALGAATGGLGALGGLIPGVTSFGGGALKGVGQSLGLGGFGGLFGQAPQAQQSSLALPNFDFSKTGFNPQQFQQGFSMGNFNFG